MSEPFEFSCLYSTSFEQIEDLRTRMLTFVKVERRDYFPVFDIFVLDIPDQGSMKLKVDIKYKSNWQMGALKAQRRNKWICALKSALAASKIYGPSGDPNAVAGPQEITLVPFEKSNSPVGFPEPQHSVGSDVALGRTDWQFSDKNAALLGSSGNIFGEEEETRMPSPAQGAGVLHGSASDAGSLRARNVAPGTAPPPTGRWAMPPEEIEMTQGRRV